MHFSKNNYLIFTTVLIGFTFTVLTLADEPAVGPMNRQLSKYISEGLAKNLTIKQIEVDLQTAEASVKESRAKFFPTINFSSRYTRAEGGRSMTLPVGDFMALMSQSPVSPEKINALNETTISLVPARDLETKFQLTQPLFAPEIVQNYRMNLLLHKSKAAEVELSQLTLVRDIRDAYYTCLQAKESIIVHSASCKRTASQLHTANKLMNAGMLTKTSVLVAEAAYAKSVTDSIKSCSDLENA
ncbi:MAG: TolC family protein, partial [Chitinispirillia bacterium]